MVAKYIICLTGGYIGDDNELLYLGPETLYLRADQRLRVYSYCGPRVSPWVLQGPIRNKTWEGACKTLLQNIPANSRLVSNSSAMKIVTMLAAKGFRNENSNGACDRLYRELLARKLYWRATGKFFGDPVDIEEVIETKDFEGDISGNNDTSVYEFITG